MAKGMSHMYAQSTGWRTTSNTSANALNWSTKWMSAAPTVAVGSTARGKRTLPTSAPLAVMDCTAVVTEVLTKVHTSRPLMIQMPNRGMPPPSTEKTTE